MLWRSSQTGAHVCIKAMPHPEMEIRTMSSETTKMAGAGERPHVHEEGCGCGHDHHDHRGDDHHHQTIAPYVRITPKVGRNEPCPCGSGKKYKKCCLD
jgi:uncharacterized protein YecA (UPF0149 family)